MSRMWNNVRFEQFLMINKMTEIIPTRWVFLPGRLVLFRIAHQLMMKDPSVVLMSAEHCHRYYNLLQDLEQCRMVSEFAME